jgi:ABC-type Zn uptake system ZnuABC Zn-binding protein ZnuA
VAEPNAMSSQELLSQTNTDLNEAHTLVEIARRILWTAENDPDNPDEPSARMRQIVEQLDQTHSLIDAALDDIERELEVASVEPSKPERHPLVH